jgi:hypothetical protein
MRAALLMLVLAGCAAKPYTPAEYRKLRAACASQCRDRFIAEQDECFRLCEAFR